VVPPPWTSSEETLAPWLASHRDEVVVATKVRFRVSDPGGEGFPPNRIRKACDASLRRMGVNEIDLYQVNAPDPDVPLEDTLEALDELVRAGKVRAIGCSNFPAYLLAWAVAIQDREGWSPFISLQPQYSLVERSIELGLLPFCRAAGLGVLPWGPLGAGFLTGRYRPGHAPPGGGRMADAGDDWEEAPHRRGVERDYRVVAEASAIADSHGATIAEVALAWLLGTEGITASIIGPRTLEQLDGLLGATELTLSAAERARLEAHAPPPEAYPQRMPREQAGIDDPTELRRRGARRRRLAERRSRSSSPSSRERNARRRGRWSRARAKPDRCDRGGPRPRVRREPLGRRSHNADTPLRRSGSGRGDPRAARTPRRTSGRPRRMTAQLPGPAAAQIRSAY
jgi:aryl-alcohol dehydrogenase-like predicted oxidoreductase